MSAPTVFEFAGLLQGFGVDLGDPERRLAKARALIEAGLCVEDAELVFAHVEATSEAGKAPRIVAALALDPKRLRDAIVDARAYRDAQEARKLSGAERAPGDKPYVPGPVEGETREVWEHDRMCSVAWCRVRGDGAAAAVVARELGVSETTLGVMLERGRVLRQSPLVPESRPKPSTVEQAERASQQRHVEFRQRMAADRAASAGRKGAPAFDWARMQREQGAILAQIRQTGSVDLAWVLRDPVRRGALATLEADGDVLRQEAPDVQQRQRYRVAADDAQRREFREQFRLWALQDMAKPRGKRAEALS
jgi:hypothetical protein